MDLVKFLEKLNDLSFKEFDYCDGLDEETILAELLLCAEVQGWLSFKVQ